MRKHGRMYNIMSLKVTFKSEQWVVTYTGESLYNNEQIGIYYKQLLDSTSRIWTGIL